MGAFPVRLDASRLFTLVGGAAALSLFARFVVPGKYRALYERVGKEQGVDPDLLHAIALQESRENPAAVSPPNANGTRDYGLMQINATNLAAFGLSPETALDAEASVRAAARLLRRNLDQAPALNLFDQLSVYNAGMKRLAGADGRLRTPDDTFDARTVAAGGYVNQKYVMEAGSWYFLVAFAHLLPVKTIDWTARA